MDHRPFLIGTAGWSIASRHAAAFPGAGTHLERYAARLACVEINSSFYRPHRPETYARWAGSVPEGFRFAVKLPRTMTHEKRLTGCAEDVGVFLSQASCLGAKLGVVLVQTPPNLAFRETEAAAFLGLLRSGTEAGIAFEPRHRSWFDGAADALLESLGIARVAADPARFPGAEEPTGARGLAYFRFHGAPKIYYSDYPADALRRIWDRLRRAREAGTQDVWCIFDNTAEGHALANALALVEMADAGNPADAQITFSSRYGRPAAIRS